MIRAAAKNQAFAAVVVDPEDYGDLLSELRESDGRLTLQRRKQLAAKAFACTARYDAAISTWFARHTYEGFPPTWRDALREGERPALRREPSPECRLLRARGLSDTPARRGGAVAWQGAVVQQSARPQLRARIGRGLRGGGAGLRDPQAQQPVRVRARRERSGGLRPRLRLRPGKRLRWRDRRQPPGRSRRRRAHERAVHRGAARAGLRRGRAGGAAGEKEREAAGAGRLARAEQRGRDQARARRAARAGPRRGHRGTRGDARDDGEAAERVAVGGPAVRVEGLPARALERDRDRLPAEPRSGSARGR